MPDPLPLTLRPLETASRVVTGTVGHAVSDEVRGPSISGMESPWDALRAAVLPGLLRPPCLVSFSGGHDSSLVLATAVEVARREGLPMPIPITWRFRGAPLADEDGWQLRVIAALKVNDWEIRTATDELDLVGPVAAQVLSRHGVLYPQNLHVHHPLIEAAQGGSLLTGLGGDQLLIGLRPVRRRRRLVRWLPPRVEFGWLGRRAASAARRAEWNERLAQPREFDQRVRWHARRREPLLAAAGLDLLAADEQVQVVHPLLDPSFAAALSVAGEATGFGGRAALLAALFGDHLPADVLTRRPKAIFNEVFWSGNSRHFRRAWDGSGLPPDVAALVDVDALRAEWQLDQPDSRTGLLLQQAWLHANSRQSAPAGPAQAPYVSTGDQP